MNTNKIMNEKSTVVGVDLGHKSWVACRFNGTEDPIFLKGNMTEKHIRRLSKWIKPEETVVIETGTASFWFKKTLESICSCKVLVLNANDLKLISGSLKKTDKEDSLKLARLAYSYPKRDLPVVRAPQKNIEVLRKLVHERRSIVQSIVSCKARFYSLCIQSGYTTVRKKQIRNSTNMELLLESLDESWRGFGLRVIEQMKFYEIQLKKVEAEYSMELSNHEELATRYLSMPGIGPVVTTALIAYFEDFSAFKNAGQVSFYAGLVPRMDQSGTIDRSGHIVSRGNLYIRSLMVQAAWSLVRSKQENHIKEFYKRLSIKIGNGKAIVATARKMLEVLYAMAKNENLFMATT